MKQTVSKLIVLSLALLSLFSCSIKSLDYYKENLGEDYKYYYIEGENLDFYLGFTLNFEDYEATEGLQAKNKKHDFYVLIIECSSTSNAKKLSRDALEYSYYSNDIEVVRDGNYVLIGYQKAINDALNNY